MRRFMPLLALSSLACMPKTFPEDTLPPHQERPVDASMSAEFNVVWEATLEVLGDAGPIEDIDENKGLIVTGWVHGASDYIFKNFAGTRIPEPIRYRIVAEVRPNSGNTSVVLINQEQVEKDMISVDMEFTGAIYRWIDVPSSTLKERNLLESILQVVESRSGGGNNSGGSDYDYQY
jgi:hypothetical protein